MRPSLDIAATRDIRFVHRSGEGCMSLLKRLSLWRVTFAVGAWISVLRRLMLGRDVSAFLVETRQGPFLVETSDRVVAVRLRRRGTYEQKEADRLRSLVGADDDVLFVGAHIGALAIPLSRSVRHVTAIEANPDTYRLLAANIVLNERTNITPLQLAANDVRGSLKFVKSRVNSGGSKRMPSVEAFEYFYDKPQVVDVAADRLDDVLPDGSFALIVMDIEGSEYFALRGMQQIVSRARHLAVEYLPHHLSQVAGITVAEFLAPIEPHFSRLHIPSKNIETDREGFLPALEAMFQANECDDGIIFSK